MEEPKPLKQLRTTYRLRYSQLGTEGMRCNHRGLPAWHLHAVATLGSTCFHRTAMKTISLVWPTSARLGWIQGLRTCGELLNMPRQQSTSRQQDCAGGEIKENLNPQGHRRTVKTEKWDMHNGRQGRSLPFFILRTHP